MNLNAPRKHGLNALALEKKHTQTMLYICLVLVSAFLAVLIPDIIDPSASTKTTPQFVNVRTASIFKNLATLSIGHEEDITSVDTDGIEMDLINFFVSHTGSAVKVSWES